MGMPGIAPKSDAKAIDIKTKIRPELAYAIDRILEQNVYQFKSRQDIFRTAVANLVSDLLAELHDGHVQLNIHRLENTRKLVGSLHQMRDITEMIALTQKAVTSFLSFDSRMDAIGVLRNAKRYMEDIPFDGLRLRFKHSLYGSPDGRSMPEGWALDEAAVLWDKVVRGELDRDDEEDVLEQVRPFRERTGA